MSAPHLILAAANYSCVFQPTAADKPMLAYSANIDEFESKSWSGETLGTAVHVALLSGYKKDCGR